MPAGVGGWAVCLLMLAPCALLLTCTQQVVLLQAGDGGWVLAPGAC